ncbi:hypothetical protein ARMSODRAFT_940305 [Armillaria solidipes]|uniref:Cap binding protein 80-PB n=1 Tax=Armillaria solidipes TaxID=1076256 RepID=A0A2H3BI64_9AGAR|nr:hypothetical protein ARMSODRAFT_940305 [Armillaria solidipes]
MSYRGRRRYRDDYDRREIIESPQDKLKSAIFKLGEVDPVEELPHLEKQIRALVPPAISSLSEAFRIGVTEQPYKIPYYAALLRLLHEQPDGEPSLGRQILEDIWKGFQTYVDQLAWRETRFCIHFFAHLTLANLVSIDSLVGLLQSLTAVLDEFGVSHGRAKRAALCAAEGLMIAGSVIKTNHASNATDIVNAIVAFNETTTSAKWIVHPMMSLPSTSVTTDNADELLDILLASLGALEKSGYAESLTSFPRPYADFPALDLESFTPFSLPSVLVPPEVIELENEMGDDAPIKKEEWPEYFIRLFENDVSPDYNTPEGYAVRTDLVSILDIFEVNRKECARILLEYPKWMLPGTFKPKPGAPVVDIEPVPGRSWQLESTIIETILGAFFVLPESSQKSIYYMSVITELCKLSPSTVGPAVGKSIRKLYGYLSDGLDLDIARRFSEWFAVHMSNFGFQWVWKEWLPDIALVIQNPRRAFMRRALEYEIRLAYYERIAKTLPEPMQDPEVYVVPKQAPGPSFEFDDPINPHHDNAQSVLNLFRGRANAEDVISHLDALRSAVEASEDGHVNTDSIVRSIAIQSLLHIGSRSFSHLLNAIERYLPLLRHIVNSGATGNVEAKTDVMNAVARFWKYNSQMVVIVFDKLMQYQIVDPTDVVAWTFEHGRTEDDVLGSPLALGVLQWDLLKGALDKGNGRVSIARKKLTVLRKEDDDTRARAIAEDGASMEVDAEAKKNEMPENPALTSAIKAFSTLTREQKSVLSRTLEGFMSYLVPSSPDVITEKAWHNRANWGKEEWNTWETWGWYRHFCRVYSPYLRTFSTTLSTVSFARLEGSTDPAAVLVQKVFNVAVGQE